ncbi:MAG TPA: cytochrome c-type biogenesis CcmF C-terminal domain-containing protein [Candidatus Dormibacteraeota bacterium]|nr:cytochrome c-type biogenesis CcmF C-terminal domain-containing protein [Candidatus Dormibacteraeota bacterium]
MPVAVLDDPVHAVILGYLGAGALLAALVMGGFSAVLSFWAGFQENAVMVQVGRRAFYAAAAMTVVAGAVLMWALLSHDFSLAYVTEHTDLSTPTALVAAGFYGGQEGSLLYWAIVLGVLGSVSLVASASLGLKVAGCAAGLMAVILSFFLVVLALVASPFDLLSLTPPDGLGLNPVLRDGGMLIHPPVVLAGFASFAIPFCFASAALLAGRPDSAWIAHTRRFALIAWSLQTTGLVLGMWWAYHVLGWAGYWGWDPVENVALMPWLATTAYLHSSMVQETRGRLRTWNFGLVILAFLLVVFGTFIVRSGVVPSVHTFAISAIGPWFLAFLFLCIAFSVVLLAARSGVAGGGEHPVAPVSREGAFVLQNLLLIGVVAVVLWGTILPLVSGMFGQQRVVGASYYERAAGPLLLVILALMAAGPLLPWRRAARLPSLRALAWPGATALIAVAVLLVAGVGSIPALLALPLVAAVVATCFMQYARLSAGWKKLPSMTNASAWRMRWLVRRRRRYGAYLAHLGLAVLVVGIGASHFWQQEKDVTLAPGQQVTVAGNTLTYTGSEQRQLADHSELVASMRFGDATLEPALATYAGLGGQALTHVAINTTPWADIYVVLAGSNPDGSAAFRVFVNPLVSWIWAGGAIIIFGVVLGNLGERAPAVEAVRRRVAASVPG